MRPCEVPQPKSRVKKSTMTREHPDNKEKPRLENMLINANATIIRPTVSQHAI